MKNSINKLILFFIYKFSKCGKYRLYKDGDNLLFENKHLVIKGIERKQEDKLYDFSVDIKDFYTPNINIKFDYENQKIVSVGIDEDENDNEPKNHVAYKLIDLCKHDLCIKFKFMIDHN